MIYLSKTDFKEYLICSKCLWLKKKRPDDYVAGEFSAFQKKLIKDGYEVEEYFKDFSPEGVLVSENGEDALRRTKELIDEKKTIFQATLLTRENIFVKIDVLKFNDESESWDLYEVKSGSSIKTDLKHNHIKDIAFQKIALDKSGIKVGKSFLVHLNKKYVRNGDLDLEKLFVINDVSDDVRDIQKETENEIGIALSLLKEDDMDVRGCGCIYKSSGQRCDCFNFFNPEVPDYSTGNIFLGNKLKELVNDDIFDPKDVDDDFNMTNNQKEKVDLQKSGVSKIDIQAIKSKLDNLEYPIYFFDYETFGKPVPFLDGYKVSQQLVFQYSLHVLQENGEIEHFEYLADNLENATSELVSSLKNSIGSVGSIIVWYESFEKGRNKELAELHSESREFLEDMNSRIFDLMKIFKKDYLHPDFKGSASIKKVLPVIVPELSYSDMEIQDGTMAIEAWGKTIFDTVSEEEREKIRKNLLKYCELDTFAMVSIFDFLKDLIERE
ncbi:DUF2779 domain-containing protein [Patescibacteria group bacterium]